MAKSYKYIILVLMVFTAFQTVFAQGQKSTIPEKDASKKSFKTTPVAPLPDSAVNTVSRPPAAKDTVSTLVFDKDSLREGKSGMDSVVVYSAKDSVVFDFRSRRMHLRGDAKLDQKSQKLEAEIIDLYSKESLLEASGFRDSSGNVIGYPKFDDNGEAYVGERIKYNFKTKQGAISQGETAMQEGFYYGEKIKRVSPNTIFIQNGKYTDCDSPHSHYYFGSPKMKFINKDKIFLDPLIFYVEDMPLLIVPVGLFFPTESGRRSGVIIPSFYFTQTRGVNLKDLGYYFALSDYFDTKITVDLFTKGGYTIKNGWNWALKDVLNGSMELQYGETRTNPNNSFDKNILVQVEHNQKLSPYSSITANLNYATSNFFKNTTINLRQTQTQEMRSNASYSHSFQNGSNFSLSYGRSQNIITSTYSQNSAVSYSLPQFKPLNKLLSPQSVPDWIRDMNFSYSVNGQWSEAKSINERTTQISEDSTFNWTDTVVTPVKYIQHRPSLSIAPKLGYFTIQPRISFSANNYFRRVTKTCDTVTNVVKTYEESGFYTDYTYNYGVSLSTKLFGIVKPRLFGLNALRHTFQPTLSYNFTPDLSGIKELKGSYIDSAGNKIVYSRFEKDGGGISSSREQQTVNYSIVNKFDAKINDADTAEKNIELLTWTMNGNYDFKKDRNKFSDISMGFRTPDISVFSFNTSAGFSLYDFDMAYDTLSKKNLYSLTDRFYAGEGKGLLRLTSFGLTLSANFSFDRLKIGTQTVPDKDTNSAAARDSSGLGERFAQKMAYKATDADIFGENTPGYNAISLPLSIGFNLNYSYSDPISEYASSRSIARSLNCSANLTMNITETWALSGRLCYDFISKTLTDNVFNLSKDLHCWQFNLEWNPIGYNKGFYLRFGIKSPQLQDLKYEKRSYSMY